MIQSRACHAALHTGFMPFVGSALALPVCLYHLIALVLVGVCDLRAPTHLLGVGWVLVRWLVRCRADRPSLGFSRWAYVGVAVAVFGAGLVVCWTVGPPLGCLPPRVWPWSLMASPVDLVFGARGHLRAEGRGLRGSFPQPA